MMNHEKLVELYRELQEEPVLSVYLDGDQHDPAERNTWRKRLDHQLDVARDGVAEEEAGAFEEAVSHLREALEGFDAFLPGKGFVAFTTADQVWYAETVPVPMPDLARWEVGIRVAPYVRGLKQERPVVLVLLDSQKARVFRYQDATVEEVEDFRADTFLGDLSDINTAKRGTNRTGIRGQTSTDAAQRFLEVSSERMVKALMEATGRYVGDHGFLIIGGMPERVSQAASVVPKQMNGRLEEARSLHVEMSSSEVKEAMERIASQMTKQYQEKLISHLVDQAKADGRACLGPDETERALREMRVDTLLLSHTLVERDPDYADRLIGTAFAGNAHVEELLDLGADVLEREGEGMAARLRFKIRGQEPETGAPEERSSPERERENALKARGEGPAKARVREESRA